MGTGASEIIHLASSVLLLFLTGCVNYVSMDHIEWPSANGRMKLVGSVVSIRDAARSSLASVDVRLDGAEIFILPRAQNLWVVRTLDNRWEIEFREPAGDGFVNDVIEPPKIIIAALSALVAARPQIVELMSAPTRALLSDLQRDGRFKVVAFRDRAFAFRGTLITTNDLSSEALH